MKIRRPDDKGPVVNIPPIDPKEMVVSKGKLVSKRKRAAARKTIRIADKVLHESQRVRPARTDKEFCRFCHREVRHWRFEGHGEVFCCPDHRDMYPEYVELGIVK